ncbi:MAG: hypothetical protein GQ542_14575 [Desulforhopalus sp.]|nr:hypothetical protein [Desulforhopalus sp.]
MSRNIILLSDGTGNGAAKRNKTNVWRLYDALDLHRDDQIAYYDDGVGSQEFLPFKLLGGAFGWGLKKNIRELYKFLCHNYKPGDRLYLFGFSRGAFTVRMLAGMIDFCGIYKIDHYDEHELDKAAKNNYNAFRSHFKTGLLTSLVRKKFGRTEPLPTEHKPKIEFIGVWDTVDAYGLPIDELAYVWDKLVYPMYFPDFRLSENVKKGCHALSVDDERKTFHPVLWDESTETDPTRIEQVWFPGVHSDVGGGYPEYPLALVALDWMLTKAEAKSTEMGAPGLHLIKQRREEISKHSDWHGPQHDSRALAGVYYRYSPRDIEQLCNNTHDNILIERPKIHRSVMERIGCNVVPYAPTGLPEQYDVVITRGKDDADDTDPNPVFEIPGECKQRRDKMLEVLDIIKLRKGLYFVMLLTTLAFFVSPFLLGCFGNDQCTSTDGYFDKILELALTVLPDFTVSWIKVLRDKPGLFYFLIVLFGVSSYLKSMAWDKTQLIANKAWAVLKSKD